MKTKAKFGLPAVRILGVLILALCFSCLVNASDFDGVWVGSTEDASGNVVNVTLTVNQQTAKFVYGPMRNCTLEFIEVQGKTNTFSASKSNGGFCDRAYPGGTLLLEESKSENDAIAYVLMSDNKEKLDSSSLKRR